MHQIIFYLYTFDVPTFNNNSYISLEVFWIDGAPMGPE